MSGAGGGDGQGGHWSETSSAELVIQKTFLATESEKAEIVEALAESGAFVRGLLGDVDVNTLVDAAQVAAPTLGAASGASRMDGTASTEARAAPAAAAEAPAGASPAAAAEAPATLAFEPFLAAPPVPVDSFVCELLALRGTALQSLATLPQRRARGPVEDVDPPPAPAAAGRRSEHIVAL